ncbi:MULTISPECIES: hypothetical protein [Prochlorococcus]|uniref:hypothetical protein n=1 Tax=Prochlorococcus TaxID=1218 RepID=UPI0007B372DA|nr:hypothetical protein [Prochlorococcus marinus]
MAFHQPAANQLRSDDFRWTAEEGMGQGCEIFGDGLGGYVSGCRKRTGSLSITLTNNTKEIKHKHRKSQAASKIVTETSIRMSTQEIFRLVAFAGITAFIIKTQIKKPEEILKRQPNFFLRFKASGQPPELIRKIKNSA